MQKLYIVDAAAGKVVHKSGLRDKSQTTQKHGLKQPSLEMQTSLCCHLWFQVINVSFAIYLEQNLKMRDKLTFP